MHRVIPVAGGKRCVEGAGEIGRALTFHPSNPLLLRRNVAEVYGGNNGLD